MESFAFGDGPALADTLLALVLDGRKTATCWSVTDGPQTYVGKRMVVRDGAGRPRAIIETLELGQRRFHEVDAAFAFDEGEGDRSLADWRKDHEAYFRRQGVYTPDMLLYCERFRLVGIIEANASL